MQIYVTREKVHNFWTQFPFKTIGSSIRTQPQAFQEKHICHSITDGLTWTRQTHCTSTRAILVGRCLCRQMENYWPWEVGSVYWNCTLPISHGTSNIIMTTDASKTAWGCTCQGPSTGRSWSLTEALSHANYLETKVVPGHPDFQHYHSSILEPNGYMSFKFWWSDFSKAFSLQGHLYLETKKSGTCP